MSELDSAETRNPISSNPTQTTSTSTVVTSSVKDVKSTGGVRIDVADLSYAVMGDVKAKRLLKNVSLSLQSGTMCALMGPSGAGKSTLLDVLADRKLDGMWSGEILINGKPRDDNFRLRTAYVLQDDVHIATLTVRETLYYACWTRVPSLVTDSERSERVDMLLRLMGIDHVADRIVGDAMTKGISGGQLKRLSIAVELVNLPEIVFLDEPTSGLDSSIALEVMSAVKNITRGDKLCISTIHQPSPEVFELYDKLVLMCAGRLVYYGNTMDAVRFFTSPQLNYHYQEGTNPAEFIIAVGGGSQCPIGQKVPRQPEHLEAMYKSSKYYVTATQIKRSVTSAIESGSLRSIGDGAVETSTFSTQLKMLMHRTWTAKLRDVTDLRAQLFKNIVIGLLIGIVFFDQGNAQEPLYEGGMPTASSTTVCAILFFSMLFTMIGNLQAIPYLASQNVVYRRELASNAYKPEPYCLSQLFTTLPIQFVFHFIFVICMFFLVNFPNTGEYFFYYLFLLFFANTCAFYSAMWLAAATASEQIAFALFPVLFLFLSNFAGFTITVDDVSPMWIWAPYLSYARWVFQGLMVNQWERFDTDGNVINGNGNMLELYAFTGFAKSSSFFIVLIFIVIFALLTYKAMWPQKKIISYMGNQEMLTRAQSVYTADPVNNDRQTFSRGSILQRTTTLTRTLTLTTAEKSDMLRATLLNSGNDGEDDDEDILVAPEPLTVDFYRASTGHFDMPEGVTVKFQKLSYFVPNKARKGEELQLLTDVDGIVKPGDMCALMGASGAGKSTLLDVLAGRKNTGRIVGSITYNDSPVAHSTAYVMQDNVHIGLLTVRESLYFAAELRCPEDWSIEEKNKRVDKILDMLGLSHVANTLVGNHNIRGISGGQLKRLSIGVEIVNLPEVMFLDEPTTGLDSSISLEVMGAVKNLANQNRTVICTIHQPSPETFDLFNVLLLMARGRVIYFGSVRDSVNYFETSPWKFYYKPHSNPADYVIAVAGAFIPAEDGTSVTGDELADYYQQLGKKSIEDNHTETGFKLSPANLTVLDMATAHAPLPQFNTSMRHQIKTLIIRALVKTRRDRRATVVAAIRHVLVGLFYGSLYFHLSGGTDPTSYTNRLGLFFFTLMFMIIGHQQSVPLLMDDRLIFYRERGAKAYGAFAYWLSSFVVQIPLIMLNTLLYSVIVFHLVELNTSNGGFGFFYIVVLLTSLTGLFIACFITSVSRSTQAALSFYPVVLFFSVAFAGFLVYIPEFPVWLRSWAPYISFMRFGFQAMVINEFEDNDNLPLGNSYIETLGFDDIGRGTCAGTVFVFLAFYALSYLGSLSFVDFEER